MTASALRVAQPPERPLMVWDGECRFCGAWIRRWRTGTGDRVDYERSQTVGARFPEISAKDYEKSVYLILPDGQVLRAAEAVFAALAYAPGHGRWLKLYRRAPWFARATEAAYAQVARRRMFFSWLTRLLWGEPQPSTYRFSGFLFTRLVGLIFMIAFLSFWTQASGLVGDHGVYPLKDYYAFLNSHLQDPGVPSRFWISPTLLWLEPNEHGVNLLLLAGTCCAFLAMAGLLPAWSLLGCVVTYGSLRNGVPVFLNFQWDALLVESGFVALLMAPWGWWQRPWALREPPRAGRWLSWWLLFKLMFLSGLVKIITNDNGPGPLHPGWFREAMAWVTGVPIGQNTWLDGTALQFHYFTQPIPGPTSWWFAHLPPWFQAWSLWATMFIELVVPFFFFAPRRARHAAGLLQIALQVALLAGGNYGFFNLLTLVLCVPLFDDAWWPERVQTFLQKSNAPPAARWAVAGQAVRNAVVLFAFLLGLIQIGEAWQNRSGYEAPAPGPVAQLAHEFSLRAQQLGLVNSYGLFRVMTTERPEIIIEGSDDGVNWKPYEFYYKPGDVTRPPSFTTPNMPRLDWQMWFAALDVYYSHQAPEWLGNLLVQLRHENPAVLGLIEKNPFPTAAPEFIRLRLYLYTFAPPDAHERDGVWWTRTLQPEFDTVIDR
jgi:predicted DCC family thiol-disulfide oxidoreductase YuxK